VYKLLLLSVLKFSPKVVIFFKDLCAVSKSSSRFSDRGVFACDRKQKKTREEVVRSSSFSSSSLTSSSYSYCALSFSRVFWSNFLSLEASGKPLKMVHHRKVCCASFCMCDYCILLQAFGCVMMTMMSVMCVVFHPRIANWVGEDSCCRGGIVNIRFGRSRVLLVRPNSSKALWRFRVSTSNSLNGRSRLQTYTSIPYIDQTYAQQDIRVYEDDHLKPPLRQYPNPKALSLLRVSI